jgi:2-oxo-4-hydroxy-4-carboxy-5-ureidoimidazoline decarboxylase
MSHVALDQINTGKAAFLAALGDIFEHAPWVAEQIFERRPFVTLTQLHDAMIETVKRAPSERQMTLIRNHPDLAGKAARAGTITADSKAEQASAGLDRMSDEEFDTFHRLNDSYKSRFKMPFIVCVRRHTKDSILHQFELRLQNEASSEREAALEEIFRIAALRLDQRIVAPDRLKVHGRVSTHVLDARSGRPAAGVAIEFAEIGRSGTATILRTATNADGRTDRPLISDRPIPIGHYEIRFSIGDYFAREGAYQADPRFLDCVPVRFAVAEAEGHYHVPLLATPWSYSTYRGS